MFEDRVDAGRKLGAALVARGDLRDAFVLGLPRGGVPVAAEVAAALGAPLDVLVVRKVGMPGHSELALGAIASGGAEFWNRELIDMLKPDPESLEHVLAQEHAELERRERGYRGAAPPPELRGVTVVLVDDGLATGATMRAAVAALRDLEPGRIVVAAPVAATEAVADLRREADEVVVLATPEPFSAVGRWYREFGQTDDETVRRLLTRH